MENQLDSVTEKPTCFLRLQGLTCDWSKHNKHSRNIFSVHGFLRLSVILCSILHANYFDHHLHCFVLSSSVVSLLQSRLGRSHRTLPVPTCGDGKRLRRRPINCLLSLQLKFFLHIITCCVHLSLHGARYLKDWDRIAHPGPGSFVPWMADTSLKKKTVTVMLTN